MKIKLPFKLPLYAKIIFCALLLGLAVKGAAVLSAPFADLYTTTVGAALRALFGALSSLIPFSIAETLILLFVPLVIWLVVWILQDGDRRRRLAAALCAALSLCAYLCASFFLLYGAGYHTTPLAKKLYPNADEVTADGIFETAVYLMVEANAAAKAMTYDAAGAAISPDTLAGTSKALCAAYNRAASTYDFLPPMYAAAKELALSVPLTYTQMAGFYTFYTGEVNVSVNYPDFTVAFTAAHEMAHQRGVAREDEADFVAFLVCISSDDPFLQYSGYMSMLQSALTALARLDEARATELFSYAADGVRSEFAAYVRKMTSYANLTAARAANALNNTYLRAQGVADGTHSYNRAVDLAVAYYYDGLQNGSLYDLVG